MGNKIFKMDTLINRKIHKQIENTKYLCQSCEETKLRLNFQNTYWNISSNKEDITRWEHNESCKNSECIRYKN